MTVTQNTDMEPKNMHGAAHLIDRGGVYYFKRRIPQSLIDALAQLAPETVELVPSELRQIFVGKEFVRYSLKTKLKKHALNLLMQAELDFNSNQELLETWLCTSALQYDTPSDDALRAMASLWVENQLKIDDEQRLDPGKSLELVHLEKGMHLMEPHYKSLLAVGGAEKRDHWVEGVVVELQKEYSIRLDPESRTTQLLRREVAMGILRIYEVIRARNGGNVVPTPQAVSTVQSVEIAHKSQRTTESAGKAVTLGEVETRYLKGQNQNSYTRKIVGAVTLFADVIGRERPIHSLRQREVTDFLHDICNLPADWVKQRAKGVPLAKLLADPKQDDDESEKDVVKRLAISTWRDNYRSPLQTFLTAAARDYADDGFKLLTTDGIRYIGSRQANEDQQRALTLDELKILYEGDAFLGLASDKDGLGLYWLSVVALFTGARPREICQINPQVDYGQQAGVWFLDINHLSAAGKGVKKSVKTGEVRRIPVHSELVKLGFTKYLERMKREGADRLFPSMRMKSGNPFSAVGAEFTQLLMDCGLYDDGAPPGNRIQGIYVLRKTFVTEARNQHVISKEITGHSSGMTTEMQDRHYIFGQEPLLKKQEQLEKLDFKLNIPHHQFST